MIDFLENDPMKKKSSSEQLTKTDELLLASNSKEDNTSLLALIEELHNFQKSMEKRFDAIENALQLLLLNSIMGEADKAMTKLSETAQPKNATLKKAAKSGKSAKLKKTKSNQKQNTRTMKKTDPIKKKTAKAFIYSKSNNIWDLYT